MKIKLTLILAMVFFVITCSIPSTEPGKNFTIEDFKLSITFNSDRYKTENLEQIDALMGDDSTLVQIKSMKINAFINNQTVYDKILLEVNVAADTTATGDLSGEIKPLLKVWLIRNPAGTNGYMLNEPAVLLENPGLQIDSEGLSIDEDVINMMLSRDSYVRSTLRLSEGGVPILGEGNFIEAKITLSAHLIIKIDDEE